MPVNPIPKDYPRASPFLMVTDINKEAEFLTTVFDAVERERIQPGSCDRNRDEGVNHKESGSLDLKA